MRPSATRAEELLVKRPERLAAGFRRVLAAEGPAPRGQINMLDGVAEPLIREVGLWLRSAEGHPWTRCGGVLRLSTSRGVPGLRTEFAALRHCLDDVLEALNTERATRAAVANTLDEALGSAMALLRRLKNPRAPQPAVPFGGLVIEIFDATAQPRHGMVALMRRQDLQ